jgi:hypothetical protein
MDPEEVEKDRRASVTEVMMADMAAAEVARQARDGDRDEEAAVVVRKGSQGRIHGARDWRLIGKV